jgi:hypothetical protein
MSVNLNDTLKGHQLSQYRKGASKKTGGVTYQADETHCSCGWKAKRAKVIVSYNEKTGLAKHDWEPLVQFRARGTQHLYEVWQRSKQGRMDV